MEVENIIYRFDNKEFYNHFRTKEKLYNKLYSLDKHIIINKFNIIDKITTNLYNHIKYYRGHRPNLVLNFLKYTLYSNQIIDNKYKTNLIESLIYYEYIKPKLKNILDREITNKKKGFKLWK